MRLRCLISTLGGYQSAAPHQVFWVAPGSAGASHSASWSRLQRGTPAGGPGQHCKAVALPDTRWWRHWAALLYRCRLVERLVLGAGTVQCQAPGARRRYCAVLCSLLLPCCAVGSHRCTLPVTPVRLCKRTLQVREVKTQEGLAALNCPAPPNCPAPLHAFVERPAQRLALLATACRSCWLDGSPTQPLNFGTVITSSG